MKIPAAGTLRSFPTAPVRPLSPAAHWPATPARSVVQVCFVEMDSYFLWAWGGGVQRLAAAPATAAVVQTSSEQMDLSPSAAVEALRAAVAPGVAGMPAGKVPVRWERMMRWLWTIFSQMGLCSGDSVVTQAVRARLAYS